jgi:hypothetical protein
MVATTPAREMTNEDLGALIGRLVAQADTGDDGEIAESRAQTLDYYHQKPFGNEVDGRSQFITSDVKDVVMCVMPDLMEIFAGGDRVVEYEPVGQEDEAAAEQATDYVQMVVWSKDNEGWLITHDWIWDTLVAAQGVLKIWVEEKETPERQEVRVNELGLADYLAEGSEWRVVEQDVDQDGPEVMYELTVERTRKTRRIRLDVVPPEEFVIADGATDPDEARLLGQDRIITVSEALDMGVDEEFLADIGGASKDEWDSQRQARESVADATSGEAGGAADVAMREIRCGEWSILVDFDGDGIAERREVVTFGDSFKVWRNDPANDHPFAIMDAIRVPHRSIGEALAGLAEDVQLLKSHIIRAVLDNFQLANNPRHLLSGAIDLETYLVNRPGAPILPIADSDGNTPDISQGTHIQEIRTTPIGNVAFPFLEWVDTYRETKSGVVRYDQGLDANSLNKTATGITAILGRSQRRIMLIARMMAATGFKRAFRKILRLVVDNPDQERVIRLRNQWVAFNTDSWNADMDVRVAVGMGHGTSEQRIAMAQMLVQVSAQVVQMQGGADGPIIDLERVRKVLEFFLKGIGVENVDSYLLPVQPGQRMPPRADPNAAKVQAQVQVEQAKLQMDGQRAQIEDQREAQRIAAEDARERERMALEHQRDMVKIEMDHALEMEKLGVEVRAKAAEMTMDAAGRREQMGMDRDMQREGRMMDAAAQEREAPEGGEESSLAPVIQTLAAQVDALAQGVAQILQQQPQKVNMQLVRNPAGELVGGIKRDEAGNVIQAIAITGASSAPDNGGD